MLFYLLIKSGFKFILYIIINALDLQEYEILMKISFFKDLCSLIVFFNISLLLKVLVFYSH